MLRNGNQHFFSRSNYVCLPFIILPLAATQGGRTSGVVSHIGKCFLQLASAAAQVKTYFCNLPQQQPRQEFPYVLRIVTRFPMFPAHCLQPR